MKKAGILLILVGFFFFLGYARVEALAHAIADSLGVFSVPNSSDNGQKVSFSLPFDFEHSIHDLKILKAGTMEDISESVHLEVEDYVHYSFIMPNYDVEIRYSVVEEKEVFSVSNSVMAQHGHVFIDANHHKKGDIVKLTKEVEDGYHIADLKILKFATTEDVTQSVGFNLSSFTFTMPNYDVEIRYSVVEEKEVFSVSNSVMAQHGHVFIDANHHKKGDIVKLTKEVEDGYHITDFKILKFATNEDVTQLVGYNSSNFTFTMPDYDVYLMYDVREGYVIYKTVEIDGIVKEETVEAKSANEEVLLKRDGYVIDYIHVFDAKTNEDITTDVYHDNVLVMPNFSIVVKLSYHLSTSTSFAVCSKIYVDGKLVDSNLSHRYFAGGEAVAINLFYDKNFKSLKVLDHNTLKDITMDVNYHDGSFVMPNRSIILVFEGTTLNSFKDEVENPQTGVTFHFSLLFILCFIVMICFKRKKEKMYKL